MPKAGWLQITDYSNKYRVSVSTLRRRIRAEEIEYQFEDGKYWLPDVQVDRHIRARENRVKAAPIRAAAMKTVPPVVPVIKAEPQLQKHEDSEALSVAREMMKEMKAAYVQILQEKEEQILILKEEMTDLRTLCRILEADNERLKKELSQTTSTVSTVTNWLDDEPDSGLDL